jgi:hypothetical protein
MELHKRRRSCPGGWNPVPTDDFDQTPAFDSAGPEPLPEFDLDQTAGA